MLSMASFWFTVIAVLGKVSGLVNQPGVLTGEVGQSASDGVVCVQKATDSVRVSPVGGGRTVSRQWLLAAQNKILSITRLTNNR